MVHWDEKWQKEAGDTLIEATPASHPLKPEKSTADPVFEHSLFMWVRRGCPTACFPLQGGQKKRSASTALEQS